MNGADRRDRLARARLYVCTPARDDMLAFLDDVLAGGVDVVQLRDKHAPRVPLLRSAEVFRSAATAHGALFIVNDDPVLAVEVRADGVHLGQEDMDPSAARAIVGGDMLIGRSTHAPEDLLRARAETVDYLGVGPVHPTPTKPGRTGTGLAYVELAAREATLPWFVTGGMDARTIPAAVAAGARRFVVVRAITEAADPGAEAKRLRALIPG